MTTARSGAMASLLNDGRVLIIGGEGNGDGGPLTSAELYDPASCTFRATGSMPAPRSSVATLLRDGRVLIAGGFDGSAGSLASALLYEPSTGSFSPTGSMTNARTGATATLLQDGRVLIAGGRADLSGDPKSLTSAELYDSTTGTFTATGSMLTAQAVSATALLPNGEVLFIIGGQDLIDGPASAELYDPSNGTFSSTGSMLAGWASSATVLQDGRVLVLGAVRNLPIGVLPTSLPSAEMYDPKTGKFTVTGTYADPAESATLLPDGRVLVLGAVPSGVVSHGVSGAKSQLFDPKTGTFVPTAPMTVPRSGPAVVLLKDGHVLVAGGDGQHEYLSSAELFVP